MLNVTNVKDAGHLKHAHVYVREINAWMLSCRGAAFFEMKD